MSWQQLFNRNSISKNEVTFMSLDAVQYFLKVELHNMEACGDKEQSLMNPTATSCPMLERLDWMIL